MMPSVNPFQPLKMEQTIEKTQVDMPADLAKRFNEAKDQKERNAVMADYATRMGAEDASKKEATFMSEDQFRSLMEKMGTVSADMAKTAIATMSEDVQRKYNLDDGDAKEVAERSFGKIEAQQRNMQ